ncbi:cytochrome P450 [Cladorrhinum samala]|uniref:Cytochrome P450 n=1 Tax=Cladorrhinum samala TaxID=585594 RepID=A0AAV9I3X7_9PEZI|nr:cytochrome P450 [Cladorrhinum samala]
MGLLRYYLPSVGPFEILFYVAGGLALVIAVNVILQLIPRNRNEPPTVFHWVPFLGSAAAYGKNPHEFFRKCREKHGDIFTFVMLGRRMTAYFGIEGNDFILNSKNQELNAEEIYNALTGPVFGSGVIYDCDNATLMEQKRFVKFGLNQEALESHVRLTEQEVLDYIKNTPELKGQSGTMSVSAVIAQITLYTAARTLQGAEVRKRLNREFAEFYHDLDMGFSPLNFVFGKVPLPVNVRRDAAHAKMRDVYMEIIKQRRESKCAPAEPDMLWNFMECTYRNGRPIPDKEIAHLMIALLMAGQHSSSAAGEWIMLRLASQPEVAEEIYQEQLSYYKGSLQPIEYADIDHFTVLKNVIKETLRVHSSTHSILRKVKKPLRVPGTDYVVPEGNVMLASPTVTHFDERYFPNAQLWDPHRWDNYNPDEIETEADMVDYGYGVINKGTRSPYIAFGAGRHRCIGEKFAYANLAIIVGTFVRHFKFSTLDGKRTVPPTDFSSMFLRAMSPATIRWERRVSE